MNFNRFIFIILASLICLFTVTMIVSLGQDAFGGQGTGSWPNSVMFAIELLSGLCILLYANFLVFTGMTRIVILWIFWVVLTCLNLDDLIFYNVRLILFWPLVYIVFYLLTKKDPLLFKKSVTFFSVLMIMIIPLFVQIAVFRGHRLQRIATTDVLASVNYIYFPLLTLPWILLISNNKIRNGLCAILTIAVAFSAKRTAIIALGTSLIVYFYYEYVKNESMTFFMRCAVPLALCAVIAFSFVGLDNSVHGYLTNRFKDIRTDQGSGRLYIYQNVIELQMQSSLVHWTLGHGHDTVIGANKAPGWRANVSAHNDFLEVLYDYGIIGFVLYILIHFLVLRRLRYLFTTKSPYLTSYFTSYVIFLLMSLLSHLILYATYFIYLAAYWGAIEALCENGFGCGAKDA